MSVSTHRGKQENPLLSLACNILIPSVILSKASGENALGPTYAFGVALLFPVVYGIWDGFQRRKFNFIAGLGLLSILLTGGLGLAKVEGIWFAVKEAAIPAVIGIAFFISANSSRPLVRAIMFNEQVMDIGKVEAALGRTGKAEEFNLLLKSTTILLSASFLLSAILNFFLAAWLLKSPAGSEEFNAELGKMTMLSYPVIVFPCLVVTGLAAWKLFRGIRALTGLEIDEVFSPQHVPKK